MYESIPASAEFIFQLRKQSCGCGADQSNREEKWNFRVELLLERLPERYALHHYDEQLFLQSTDFPGEFLCRSVSWNWLYRLEGIERIDLQNTLISLESYVKHLKIFDSLSKISQKIGPSPESRGHVFAFDAMSFGERKAGRQDPPMRKLRRRTASATIILR